MIRPYLQELVGDEAAKVDGRLSTLLKEAAAGAAVEESISDLLYSFAATRDWTAQVLGDEQLRPPELQHVVERSYSPLPGEGEPIPAQKFVCPLDANYVWWRRSVGTAVPKCPDHNVQLVSA